MRGYKPTKWPKEVTLEGRPHDVQRQNSEIDFMAADITVMAQQPGLGKTHAVIKFCEENPTKRILYLTNRHRLIKEITRKLNRGIHWYGFGYLEDGIPKGCPKFLDSSVQRLYSAGLSPLMICGFTKCDKAADKTAPCLYFKQFRETGLVFAPVEYINTNHLWEGDDFRFDICFLDESILKTEEISFDMEETLKALDSMERFADVQYIKTLIETKNYKGLSDKRSMIVGVVLGCLTKAAYAKDYDAIDSIRKFNVGKIIEFGRYDSLYGDKSYQHGVARLTIKRYERYYKPFSYKLFEIAQKVPVVMLDASFEKGLFLGHLTSFNFEYGLERDLEIVIYRSKVNNPNSVIFRMNPKSAHPKVNFTDPRYKDSTLEGVNSDLKNIISIFGPENVGVITYKELTYDNVVTNREEFSGLEAMHYGNLLGSNSLEGRKVLVILGSYDIPRKQVADEINKHYLTFFDEDNISDAKELMELCDPSSGEYVEGPWQKDKEDGYRGLWEKDGSDPEMFYLPWQMAKAYGLNEVYQALHRSRFLINDVIIFAYCHLPDAVFNEAPIIKVYRDGTEKLFGELRDKHYKPRTDLNKVGAIVKDLDEGLSPTNICRKYKLRGKGAGGSLKTKAVKGMREVSELCRRDS